jgi:hypothetical protein
MGKKHRKRAERAAAQPERREQPERRAMHPGGAVAAARAADWDPPAPAGLVFMVAACLDAQTRRDG